MQQFTTFHKTKALNNGVAYVKVKSTAEIRSSDSLFVSFHFLLSLIEFLALPQWRNIEITSFRQKKDKPQPTETWYFIPTNIQDPNSIIFTADLHIRFPANLFNEIRKVSAPFTTQTCQMQRQWNSDILSFNSNSHAPNHTFSIVERVSKSDQSRKVDFTSQFLIFHAAHNPGP